MTQIEINRSERIIDSHVHTSGVSMCSKVTSFQAIDAKISEGYQGIILTNHCQPWYYKKGGHAEYCKNVIAEWEKANEYGEKKDFLVLLGLEVTIESPYNDYLIYGIDVDFFIDSPCFYGLGQEGLYEYCKEKNAFLIQAHPYRHSGPADPRFLHGVEINCSPGDAEKKDLSIKLAEENEYMLFCGTDYHGDKRTHSGGIIIPRYVKTNKDFNDYLNKTKVTRVFFDSEVFDFPIKR